MPSPPWLLCEPRQPSHDALFHLLGVPALRQVTQRGTLLLHTSSFANCLQSRHRPVTVPQAGTSSPTHPTLVFCYAAISVLPCAPGSACSQTTRAPDAQIFSVMCQVGETSHTDFPLLGYYGTSVIISVLVYCKGLHHRMIGFPKVLLSLFLI